VQALAPDLPIGLGITRSLLGAKLVGQARVLTTRLAADDAASTVLDLADGIGSATTIEECRSIEPTAAALYFQTWGTV
jgi:CRISPR/Cas system-associated endonuclease Cas1